MKTFNIHPVHKLCEIPQYKLFLPPPYCRTAERKNNATEENTPPLKLVVSNPSKLLSLFQKLHDSASKTLEIKINTYLLKEAECQSAFLIHLLPELQEVLVQAVGKEELETSLRLPVCKEVMKELIQYENKILKCDNYLDPQLTNVFVKLFGERSVKIISVPILPKQKYYPCSTQGLYPALLVSFVNSQKEENFLIRLANELFQYCLPVLLNIMKAEEEMRQKRQYESLLETIRKFYLDLDNVNKLLKTIADEAKNLTNAQKCSLFLVDPDDLRLVRKVFNIASDHKLQTDVKITNEHVLPEHVATTGEILNLQNNSDHPITDNKNLTEFTGFKTRNILCFPIKNKNEIIGVIQLCNKRSGDFHHFDVDIASFLSTHCGLAIMQSLKYTQVENFKIRSSLTNELMCHVHVDKEEADKKSKCPLIHYHADFDNFTFSPRTVLQIESDCFVLKMFDNLGFSAIFPIERDKCTRFVMSIKKACLEVPYHNWMHLFSCAHFAYLCLKKLNLVEEGYITNLEALAYFVACLCHDVDFRAVNNPFQEKPSDTLCSLYSSPGSVLERYRLSQIFRILYSDGCNFLEVLSREDYALFTNLLKDLVLATDLATHFKFYNKQHNMVVEGYNRNNPEHRYVFTSLLMTCADLSDQTKDWSVVKDTAVKIFQEFFTQGDLEKKSDKNVITMSNINSVSLADLQIQFLTEVCLPIYKLLAAMFPSLKQLVFRIKENRFRWEATKHIFQKAIDKEQCCLEVLSCEEFDQELEATMQLLNGKN